MRLPHQNFNFFFAAALTMILMITATIDFGNTNTLAATLAPPIGSPIQAKQGNTAQSEGQIGKIDSDAEDQLQLKDTAQAMAQKSEQPPQGMISHITIKYQKEGKIKQSGGLKRNIGWLTF